MVYSSIDTQSYTNIFMNDLDDGTDCTLCQGEKKGNEHKLKFHLNIRKGLHIKTESDQTQEQVVQRGCRISLNVNQTQLAGHDPEQSGIASPALS